MGEKRKFLESVESPHGIITAIDLAARFPEVLWSCRDRYREDISLFKKLVNSVSSTNEMLERIRSSEFSSSQRMNMLKIFRRCVSPVVDTEMAKKIKIPTSLIIGNYGETFKSIELLSQQFNSFSDTEEAALSALIGEYDTRGQLGYRLTERFFEWFESRFSGQFSISGPRGAGRDVELKTIFNKFDGNYPCDFVIRTRDGVPCAIGFARYDSTRGGAQSDDRTGGNSDKVSKAIAFSKKFGEKFRIIFVLMGQVWLTETRGKRLVDWMVHGTGLSESQH